MAYPYRMGIARHFSRCLRRLRPETKSLYCMRNTTNKERKSRTFLNRGNKLSIWPKYVYFAGVLNIKDTRCLKSEGVRTPGHPLRPEPLLLTIVYQLWKHQNYSIMHFYVYPSSLKNWHPFVSMRALIKNFSKRENRLLAASHADSVNFFKPL